MWELDHREGWAPKSWCFQTVVLEKTLESQLDSKEIKRVSPKGNEPWVFIGGLMLKLKLQYLGYLVQRTNPLEKTLMLGKSEGKRRTGQQKMSWLDVITNFLDMSLGQFGEIVKDGEAWCVEVPGVAQSRTWLSTWTMTSILVWMPFLSFSSLLTLAGAFCTVLNKNRSDGHPRLVPDVRGKLFECWI